MAFITNLSLVRKITLLTTLGLILAIVVFGFLGMRAVNQATEAMLQDRLATASLVAQYLDETIGRALIELERTAQMIEYNGVNGNLEFQIGAFEDIYTRFSIYVSSIYIVNQEGQVIWSKQDDPRVRNINITYYTSISQAIREGKTTISGLTPAPVTHNSVVLLSSPIKEGKEVLVVAVDIGQSSMGGFVQPIKLGQTGYVEIVDQNGIVVTRTKPGPKLYPFEQSDHSGRFAELIATGEPTRGLCHTCHAPIQKVERKDVLAFVPLSQVHWGVVIRQSEEEALASVRELRQNLLFVGTGLIIIALLFVVITTRGIVNRIRILMAASQRIAEGDLISPLTSPQNDEIGKLTKSFEDMRIKLRTSYGDLEQRAKELSSLLTISDILTSVHDLSNIDTALDRTLDKTLEIIRKDTGGILLMDEERQMLCYRVHRGLSAKYVEEMCLKPGQGIAGKVAKTGESIIVEDILKEPLAAHSSLIKMEGLRASVSVPLYAKGKVLGVLNIASRDDYKFSSRDMRLLEGIAKQIAVAVEKARLYQEVQSQDVIRGELLHEIFSVQEEERRRIARELHDETSQVLASLTASHEAALSMIPAGEMEVKAILKRAQDLSISMLDDMHRLIYELRPTLLDDLGLVAAVRWLADTGLRAAGIKVYFKVAGRTRRLSPRLEITLFRVIQEAVGNIARHAHAKNVWLSLHFEKRDIGIYIKDDGKGFNLEEAISSKDRPRGLGLLGMKERVELIGGILNIRSHQVGGGTEIDINISTNNEV